MCDYCGEEPGTKRIMSPNAEDLDSKKPFWKVCKTCRNVIQLQQKWTLGHILQGKHDNEIARKMIRDAEEGLQEIEIRTGKKIYSGIIRRKQ